MEFKLIRTSDYVTPLDENYDDIFNENYMNQLFYKKIDSDGKEVYIEIEHLDDLIELKKSKQDIIIGRKDKNKIIVIEHI